MTRATRERQAKARRRKYLLYGDTHTSVLHTRPPPWIRCPHCAGYMPKACPTCAGTNRVPIPWAEVMKCR